MLKSAINAKSFFKFAPMKKILILIVSLAFIGVSCNPQEEKDFQKSEEDCGCEDDSTATN